MATTIPCTNGINKPQMPPLAEAPVSLNTYVDVPNLGRVQITGRGHSAREAVQHLLCATEELRAQTQPQGPAPTPKPTLGELLACGLGKAAQAGDSALVDKLSKAAYLVLSGAVEKGSADDLRAVRSQQDAQTWYDVSISSHTCTCPSWEHAARAGKTLPCKHVLAACMAEKMQA